MVHDNATSFYVKDNPNWRVLFVRVETAVLSFKFFWHEIKLSLFNYPKV